MCNGNGIERERERTHRECIPKYDRELELEAFTNESTFGDATIRVEIRFVRAGIDADRRIGIRLIRCAVLGIDKSKNCK